MRGSSSDSSRPRHVERVRRQHGSVRTDVCCTECGKNFIALLDFDIDGAHVVECPHCGHEHCRIIKDGMVSEDRWDSRPQRDDKIVKVRRVWKHDVLQANTKSASEFMRARWLEQLK